MEVEIKAKCPENEFPIIRAKLLELGAIKKKEKHQADQYYNPPHADFSKDLRYIRLRKEKDNAIFAYHETLAHGLASEFETKIEKPAVFEEALERIGFQKLGLIDKTRETYQFGEFEICLDKVKGIGTFIEIETDGNPQNHPEKRQDCIELLKKIGLDENTLTTERLAEIATQTKPIEKVDRAAGSHFEELLFIIRTVINEEEKILAADGKSDISWNQFGTQFRYLEEEIGELKDAIQENDAGHINEEIGHVLYDTMFLAISGEKEGKVSLQEVFKELNWSMKFRHPYAFEGPKAKSLEEVHKMRKERKDAYHEMKKQTEKGYR